MQLNNFLPQQQPMRLIDSIFEVNDRFAKCSATISENNIFYDTTIQGVYSWVGIELMAQTAAVFASHRSGQGEPQVGFLMSVRKFSSTKPYFKLYDLLNIVANCEFLEDNIGVFDCGIYNESQLIASAKLNAFVPTAEQAKSILRGE